MFEAMAPFKQIAPAGNLRTRRRARAAVLWTGLEDKYEDLAIRDDSEDDDDGKGAKPQGPGGPPPPSPSPSPTTAVFTVWTTMTATADGAATTTLLPPPVPAPASPSKAPALTVSSSLSSSPKPSSSASSPSPSSTSISPTTSVAVPKLTSTSQHSSPTSTAVPSTTLSVITSTKASTSASSPFATAPSTSPGRKGVEDKDDGHEKTKPPQTASITATVSIPSSAAETALAEITGQAQLQVADGHIQPLPPAAEKALIAAGTVGAVIILALIIYVILKFTSVNLWSSLKYRLNPWQWFDNFRKPARFDYGNDMASPGFSNEKYSSNGGTMDTNTASRNVPIRSQQIATTAELERAEKNRQRLIGEGLRGQASTLSFDTGPPLNIPYPNQSNMNPSFVDDRGIPTQSIESTPQQWKVTNGETRLRQEPSGRYHQSHMSAVSSLSSGFGDAEIDVAALGLSNSGTLDSRERSDTQRQSRQQRLANFASRFSRSSSSIPDNQGIRDTIYTTTSEESAPRFRTVNSWVDQQSRSVRRRKESDAELLSMPGYQTTSADGMRISAMPTPLHVTGPLGSQQYVGHVRGPSELTDIAFKAHPGDEVVVGGGSRVPSSILDGRLGQ